MTSNSILTLIKETELDFSTGHVMQTTPPSDIDLERLAALIEEALSLADKARLTAIGIDLDSALDRVRELISR